MELQY